MHSEGQRASKNSDLQTLLQQGRNLLDRGSDQAALEHFQQALTLDVENPQVLFMLGLACCFLEQYQDAVVYFNKALANRSDYTMALAWRGIAYDKVQDTQKSQIDFEKVLSLTLHSAEDWRSRGKVLNYCQRDEESIAAYNKALEIDSDDYLAWCYRANSLYNLELYEEAITSYSKSLEIKPNHYSAWYNQGDALRELERHEEAIASYDQVIKIRPDNHDAWQHRGYSLRDLGRHEEAIASYDQVIKIRPDDHNAWQHRGYSLQSLERYEEAIASYGEVIKIQPDDDYAWRNRGHSLRALGKHEEAIASYDQVIKIRPDDHNAWQHRGYSLQNLERYEEAIASYDEVIKIQLDDYYVWLNRGIALQNLGRYEEAIISYDQVIKIEPNDYSAWCNRGYSLQNLGKHEEAIASYDQVIKIRPDDHNAWQHRGYSLQSLERYEEAIASYDEVIKIQLDDYYVWLNRGIALQELGHYEEAIASSDQAIKIKPNNHYAWLNRGIALQNLGRYEEATISYDQVIKIQPDDHNAWCNRGIALQNLEQYGEAISSYDQAIKIEPNDYSAWHNRGYSLRNLGQCEEAISSYDQAIKIKPDHPLAWYGRGVTLCDFLRRYQEAITCFDQVLSLTNSQDWQAWDSRGVALSKSGNIPAAIATLDDGIKVLQTSARDFEKGCGNLYSHKGNFLYIYGYFEDNPFPNWFAARDSYETALTFLTFDKYPDQHLKILTELLQVYSVIGDIQALQKKQEEATQRLEELLQSCKIKGEEITLRRKFAAFDQLRVDIYAQSSDQQQQMYALELAEKRKNTCLSWLREGWDYQPRKFTYEDMQRLLNPQTAAVYWHISSVAITTFIIKHNQPPLILKPQLPLQLQKKGYNAYTYQLQRFQSWMQEWKTIYQDYCQGNYLDNKKEAAPWRKNIKSMLLTRLNNILEINQIKKYLQDIDQLILIPHRDLHLLPLDYLFPERYNITYLPSFQIGLKLLAQVSYKPPESTFQTIMNVATSDLPFATIESVAIAALYPDVRQLKIPPIKQQSLISELRDSRGLFHFTGHSNHFPEDPRESFLMLADDDRLTLGDIVDDDKLDLTQYELICLSACETGITSSASLTDEYVGLVSGFLAKGAKYVISTLWRVNERSTAILMIKFYQLIKQREDPRTSLKLAKKWLRELTYASLAEWYAELAEDLSEPQAREYLKTEIKMILNNSNKIQSTAPVYGDPYYWAGFILTGKPE